MKASVSVDDDGDIKLWKSYQSVVFILMEENRELFLNLLIIMNKRERKCEKVIWENENLLGYQQGYETMKISQNLKRLKIETSEKYF
jgi:hypothetical protein